jgi:putative SOS response-associated peptidase YedK
MRLERFAHYYARKRERLDEELWLTGELDDAVELLRPLAPERLTVAPANPALNKVGDAKEGPQLLVAPTGHP